MFKPTLKKKSSINIIPMIDVIFFLLVFFMLFTSFRANPYGIDLQLPKAVTVTEQSQQNFIIDVNQNGETYFEGNRMALDEISRRAANEFQNNNNLVLIINADENTRYKHVVNVMDSMRQVGISRIALAAEEEQ